MALMKLAVTSLHVVKSNSGVRISFAFPHDGNVTAEWIAVTVLMKRIAQL